MLTELFGELGEAAWTRALSIDLKYESLLKTGRTLFIKLSDAWQH